ncbi:efflux RND transporter permease subunit [Cohnella pontilimi]|uniref:efflux RND transporter permease subunit n=1 Tax=Cohnella pontilimi TaxID=2564100 RepID=UPI00145FB512|nr:efflux RND transporter permease subunit [Cohnella pontilimi]
MSFLTKISLKNSVAVIILCILVLSGGIYASKQIQLQTFPDVTFPAVFVQAQYAGQSAEDVERDVAKPIEQSLMNMKGYDSITSTITENSASIFVMYPFGKDMDKLQRDIQDVLNKVKLPDKAKVEVKRLSTGSQPIFQAAVSSADEGGLQTLLEQEAMPELEKIAGISSVTVAGTQSAELRVNVDKEKAMKLGINLQSIRNAIQSQSFAFPLGSVQEGDGSIPVRITGNLASIRDLEQLELAPAVKLSDIASVAKIEEQKQISRYNGQKSFIIEAVKTQDANTAEVAKSVKDTLDKYAAEGNFQLHVIQDSGTDVIKSVNTVVREGLFGALFTTLVILLFLRNIRATLIAIISLPLSIFGTIAVIHQMNLTLNLMTLGGLAVSVGRIVDDSIVMIENIYRWKTEKGKEMKNKDLIYRAAKEVIGAIASSTIATVVVFLPIAFVGGVIGEIFRPFAITVVVSILSSLLIAVVLTPVLSKVLLTKVKHEPRKGWLTIQFEKLLRGSLRRRGWVVSLAALLLIGSFGLVPLLGVTFLPSGQVSSFSVNVALPSKTELAKTDELAHHVESYFKQISEVESTRLSIGFNNKGRMGNGILKQNEADFFVQLKENAELTLVVERVKSELPKLVSEINAEAAVNVKESQSQGPSSGNNIQIDLYSDDFTELSKAAGQVEDYMNQNGQLKNVSNNLKDVQTAWVMTLNETGRQAKVNPLQLVSAVGEQLRPVEAGSYAMDGNDWNVTLSYQEPTVTKSQFEAIQIPTAMGIKPLGEIADITETKSPVVINHQEGRASAQVTADIRDGNTNKVSKEVKKEIQALSLPKGVEVSIGGGFVNIANGFKDIGVAIVAAIGLVFLVLSATFGGMATPLVILSSLLFVPIGALSGLLISGQTLSVSALIGMLMLIGIVVTNAVVLLVRVESNRREGMDIAESLIEASTTRLRPILMTACATICALIPLALSNSASGLISKGLAVTVIGGLTTSTLLTLIVVPVIYSAIGKYRKIETE